MLFPGVKKIGKRLGLERADGVALGKLKNAFIRLYDGRNMKVLEMTYPALSEADKERVDGVLAERGVKRHEWAGSRLIVRLVEAFKPYSSKKLLALAEELAELSLSVGDGGSVKCEQCGDAEKAEAYSVPGGSAFLCEACRASLGEKMDEEKRQYDSAPRNYLPGAVGAFALALPGVLLTAAFFIFLDRLAAISAVLYVFLAIKGYGLLKGRMDRIGALIINAVGVGMTCIGVYISYFLMILYKVKSWPMTREIMAMPEVVREMRANVVIALTVSLIYIVFNTYEMLTKWRLPELKRAVKID